jgi:hypothetical protein
MTLQAILTSLKKIRGRRQPPYINSSLAAHPQPRLTQPFCSAKKIPPACLENLYISNMSNSFVEACPGDVLSTKVVIADDKVISALIRTMQITKTLNCRVLVVSDMRTGRSFQL